MGFMMKMAADSLRRGHQATGQHLAAQFHVDAAKLPLLAGAVEHMKLAFKRGDFIGAADAIQYGMLPFLPLYEAP